MDVRPLCFQYSDEYGRLHPIRVVYQGNKPVSFCLNDVMDVLESKQVFVEADEMGDFIYSLRLNKSSRPFAEWLTNLLYHTDV